MQLFRQEAMRSQDRLHGDIDLAPPTSWQVIAIGIAVTFALAITFLSVAHYAHVAEATGVVESTLGTVDVTGTLAGTVSRVAVVEGQHVRKGDVLLVVDHRTSDGGGSLEARRAAALAAQGQAITSREPAMRQASDARIAALSDEAAGSRADLAAATEQMTTQQQLIDAARQDLTKAQSIARDGFISQQDIRRREESLATREQGMSRLRQQAATARAAISRATRDIEQERANLSGQIGQIATERADLQSRAAASDAAPQTTLVAAADGTVTGVVATPGATLAAGAIAMSIIPDGGNIRIRLMLPPQAAAMVAPGQVARIAVDAFPYQTYGMVPARISSITGAAVPTKDGERFVAYAVPQARGVVAYGQMRPLRPGMTANARIRVRDQSLMQWLLDPLYAVAR